MLLKRCPQRPAKVLICLAIILFLFHFFHHLDFSIKHDDTWNWTSCPGSSLFEPSCSIPRAKVARDTQIVLRTGGSEPWARIRSHLGTVLLPVPHQDVLIFSDMDEIVGGHHVYDIYAEISEQERAQYPEFALYDEQQRRKREGEDTREPQGEWSRDGWTLGKYMNLAIKRKIWKMQNDNGKGHQARKKWFVFFETDTYVEWDNLFALLEQLDAEKEVYIGSPVPVPGLQFAHGGTAYVLSYAALEALNKPGSDDEEEQFYSQFGLNTTALCCGDEALARALQPRGVNLTGYSPLFNGESPDSFTFGPDLWCEPLISLHHVSGEDLRNLWHWIEQWRVRTRSKRPFLFKDLFDYIAPQLTRTQMDWDNTDDAWKIHPPENIVYSTFEQCQAACDADPLCFQFVHHGTDCAISHHIRIGRKRSPEDEGRIQYMSGWNLKRIRNWTRKTRCRSAQWTEPNPSVYEAVKE